MSLTKKDIQNIETVVGQILGKQMPLYQKAIIEAVDFRFQKVEQEISVLRQEIQRLTITLDNFVKMMTDYKEEFTILKAEVDKIKIILKEKLGVEVSL